MEVAINEAIRVIIYGKEASRWCLHCTTSERNEVAIGQPDHDPGHSHGSLENPALRGLSARVLSVSKGNLCNIKPELGIPSVFPSKIPDPETRISESIFPSVYFVIRSEQKDFPIF